MYTKRGGDKILKHKEALNRDASHHTSKHMKMMRAQLKQGKTFQQAHKYAKQKIGC